MTYIVFFICCYFLALLYVTLVTLYIFQLFMVFQKFSVHQTQNQWTWHFSLIIDYFSALLIHVHQPIFDCFKICCYFLVVYLLKSLTSHIKVTILLLKIRYFSIKVNPIVGFVDYYCKNDMCFSFCCEYWWTISSIGRINTQMTCIFYYIKKDALLFIMMIDKKFC